MGKVKTKNNASKSNSDGEDQSKTFKKSILYEHLLKSTANDKDGDARPQADSKVSTVINNNNPESHDDGGDANARLKQSTAPSSTISVKDKIKLKIMNLSLKANDDGAGEDTAFPLNLCVKKSGKTSTSVINNEKRSTSQSSASSSSAEKQNRATEQLKALNLVNELIAATNAHARGTSMLSGLAGGSNDAGPSSSMPDFGGMSQFQQQQLMQQPRKRGRKPKLSSTEQQQQQAATILQQKIQQQQLADISALMANSFLAANNAGTHLNKQPKHRKRGRPPTLSPPPPGSSQSGNNARNVVNKNSTGGGMMAANKAPDASLGNWPALNALSMAAAAAAASSQSSSNNSNPLNALAAAGANPFALFSKLVNSGKETQQPQQQQQSNALDALLNANLFGQFTNQQILNNLDAFSSLASTSGMSKAEEHQSSAASTSSQAILNKNSSAHKPHANEKLLRIPLNHDWKRYTYITSFHKSGTIEGEVIYKAPDGRKIKSHTELIRYLTKNAITSLTRENFSFNTNFIVGQFVENISGFNEVILSEEQVRLQMEEVNKLRNMFPQTAESKQQQYEKKRRVRDSGGSRNVYDSIKSLNACTDKMMAKSGDNNGNHTNNLVTITPVAPKMGQKRKLENHAKSEFMRAEKMRKQQEEERRLNELKELKEKQEEEKRQKEAVEAQKAHELQIELDLENERNNQHQLFIQAFDQLITSLEREMHREEEQAQRAVAADRMQIKKVLEVELMKEMKKPVEDMLCKDHKPLPVYNRIPGLKLTGKAFADCLMVFEFLYNFGETLNFDIESLPTLNDLMMFLLNLDAEAEAELTPIILHLIVCAIEDPGMPSNVTTALGQKLKDAPVNAFNMTEVLRLYFQAFVNVVRDEDRDKRVECRILQLLSAGIPFMSMNAPEKLDVLVFLCNELLSNQAIVKQIEDDIESVNSIKKDRWLLENDLRKMRVVKMRREKIADMLEHAAKIKAAAAAAAGGGGGLDGTASDASNLASTSATNMEDDDGEATNTSATTVLPANTNPSSSMAAFAAADIGAMEDDLDMTNEEVDKKIDKLNKQMNNMTVKLNKAFNSFRVFPLGQDRYRRTYWLLPNSGGVFVEAMESGDPQELVTNIFTPEELEILKKHEEEKAAKLATLGQDENGGRVKLEDASAASDGDETLNEEDECMSTTSMPKKNDQEERAHKVDEDDDEEDGEDDAEIKMEMEEEELLESEEAELANIKWFDIFSYMEQDDAIHDGSGVSANNAETALPKEAEVKPEEVQQEVEAANQEDVEEEEELDPKSQEQRECERILGFFLEQATLECLFKPDDPDSQILQENIRNIVSAYSKSLQGVNCPGFDISNTDLIVCPVLQKRIQVWKMHQYQSVQKVPCEHQLGWWRITNAAQLKSIVELLHSNGFRERNLQRHLIKHLASAQQSCKSTVASFEVNDFDTKLSENRNEFGVITETHCFQHPACHMRNHCVEVALAKDIEVLEQLEAFEEKILSSSMQVRSWKPSSTLNSSDFRHKSSQIANGKSAKGSKAANKKKTIQREQSIENGDNSNDNETSSLEPDSPECSDLIRIQREKLLEVEAFIERRYLKPPLGFKNSALLLAANSTGDGNSNGDSEELAADENAPTGLLRWRDAVRDAKCGAQIGMCLSFLENCIAWDKSVMRASCQFCGSGENEAQLLLCDLCDKGYHMYCFKPKMETVPQGDWFCFECQNKNTIDKACIVCGKKGKLLNCDTCAKVFHPNCIDPPVTKQLKGRWVCHMCQRKNKRYIGKFESCSISTTTRTTKKAKSSINSAETSKDILTNDDRSNEPNSSSMSSCSSSAFPASASNTNGNASGKESSKRVSNGTSKESGIKKKTKKEDGGSPKKNKKASPEKELTLDEKANKEITSCFQILEEMEKHENGWPFLHAVNTKQFPTYKKIIKKPMNMNMIRSKFDAYSYKSKEDFAQDIRLMFDNCQTFNEDESPVGQAGHGLRSFFESRWNEHFA